jgi:hypothetical protein
LINNNQYCAIHSLQRQLLRPHHSADQPIYVHGAESRDRLMAAYPRIHVRMETIGLPLTTVTILMNEDPLATVESQLDTLERLIAQYGATAFLGEPDTEPPRQTA